MTQLEYDRACQKIFTKYNRQYKIIKGVVIFCAAVVIAVCVFLFATEGISSALVGLLLIGGFEAVISMASYRGAAQSQVKELAALDRRLYQAKKAQEEVRRVQERRDEEKAAQEAIISLAKYAADTVAVSKPTSCPNCGAPLESDVCSYCGTIISRRTSDVMS